MVGHNARNGGLKEKSLGPKIGLKICQKVCWAEMVGEM